MHIVTPGQAHVDGDHAAPMLPTSTEAGKVLGMALPPEAEAYKLAPHAR